MIAVRGAPRVLFAKPAPGYRAWPFSNDFTRTLYRAPSSAYPALTAAVGGDGIAFYDGVFEPGATPERLARLAAQFPIVAMGVVSPVMALTTEVQVRALRKFAPDTRIVLGGHHPTFYAEQWVRRGVDAVVRHEGEDTFPELVERFLSGADPAGVSGVTWSRDGEPVHEADRVNRRDLDSLPLPDWSIIDFSLYDLGLLPHGRTGTVETARGCGHHCSFCAAAAMWHHHQRFKGVERVTAEIDALYQRGVRQLMIADDNFGVHRERDLAIFDHLAKYDVALWAFVRADTVYHDPEWVRAATAAGLRMALVGFENLSTAVLDAYDKDQKGDLGYAAYREVYRSLKTAGAFVYGLFVRDYEFSDDDAWPARRIAKVCDISAQSRFIPMRGVAGAEKLVEHGYELKDMFYHDRFWPSFTRDGRVQDARFAKALVVDLLKPRNFVKMFFGSYVERTFFRRLYGGLLRDVLAVTPRRWRVARIAARRSWSPQKRQEAIVRLVLGADR
ncbi:MAG: radical SAM protein [Candidatus Lernaella stagnicola]|nr:radical SAM protein [Candidatus Lernaella stagnicola]